VTVNKPRSGRTSGSAIIKSTFQNHITGSKVQLPEEPPPSETGRQRLTRDTLLRDIVVRDSLPLHPVAAPIFPQLHVYISELLPKY